MLLVNAKTISDYFKENMQVSVMMKQNVSDDSALAYKAKLDKERYIKSSVFVSKEQGMREMADMLGEDFLDKAVLNQNIAVFEDPQLFPGFRIDDIAMINFHKVPPCCCHISY
jgi:cell division transport system permease protein